MNSASLSGGFQHNGLTKNGSVPVKHKAHEIKGSASVFTVNDVRKTEYLPISFELKAAIGLKVA